MNESIKIIDSDQVIKDLLKHFKEWQIIRSLVKTVGKEKIKEYLEEVK
ncbi:MAG: hypothetical protein JG776_489 [Caloramator sp.]|jgi:hypothetical protein|nr:MULTISPECIES: hypothetical protein [unclassified Caloramator]MBZ4662807.1 hypothetical protein [Caloramator sp.]